MRRPVLFLVGLFLLAAAGCNPACGERPPGPAPATEAFLDATDFDGKYTPSTPVVLGGQSVYNGRIVFSNLPRLAVEGVLPADLQLAVNTSATKNVHPVALMFGHQTMTSWVFPGGLTYPIGSDYLELILIVPFVQASGKTEWHNYVVRMFVDDYFAWKGGNDFFGYRKDMATLTDSASDFAVTNLISNVFAASLSDFGAWYGDGQAESTLANYRHAKEIFRMPILGTLTQYPGSPYVCSHFDWNFTSSRARSLKSLHAVLQPFGTGIGAWVALGEVPGVADGAFEVEGLVWRLGLPDVCSF